MNMAFKPHSVAVRVLDQTDANELARIDAFIAASAQGTVFHRPAAMTGAICLPKTATGR